MGRLHGGGGCIELGRWVRFTEESALGGRGRGETGHRHHLDLPSLLLVQLSVELSLCLHPGTGC